VQASGLRWGPPPQLRLPSSVSASASVDAPGLTGVFGGGYLILSTDMTIVLTFLWDILKKRFTTDHSTSSGSSE
jgi:hypothetical protein